MDRERIEQFLERAILGVVLGILVFSPLAFGAVRDSEFGIVVLLTVVALGLWAVRLWVSPRVQLLWPPACWGVLAFTGYAVFRAQDVGVAFDAQRELLRILVYASLFLLVLNNLYRQDSTKIITLVLVFLGMGLALYGISQFFTKSEMILHVMKPDLFIGRASGTFVNPNHLAGYLVMLIPLAVAFSLASRVGHSVRIITAYSALVMLGGVIFSLSRGGWIAAVASISLLLVVAVSRRRYRIPAIAALCLVLAAGMFFYAKAERKIQERIKAAMTTGHDRDPRWRIWPAAVEIWQENIWLGVGPAQFDHYYHQRRLADNHSQTRPRYTHNEYLAVLVDYGVAGVLIMSLAVGLLLGGGWRTWHALNRSSNSEDEFKGNKRAVVLGASVSLIAIFIHAVVDFQFHMPANAILMIVIGALLTSHVRFASERWWVPLGGLGKGIATVAILVAIACLSWRGAPYAMQGYFKQKAEASRYRNVKIENLERAIAQVPGNYDALFDLGETYRLWSWQGNDDYKEPAKQARTWFERAMQANPFDPMPVIHYGMCLDWLGQRAEATAYFARALELDPNNYYAIAAMGWHQFQMRKYAAALAWFKHSLALNWWNNPMSLNLYNVCIKKMQEGDR